MKRSNRESDLRLLPAELVQRSLSDREIVLEYADALAALEHLSRADRKLLGWEGWLRHPDGSAGHSSRHQGTVSLEHLSPSEAVALCRDTINSAHAAWERDPEVLGARLYFCLTVAPV